MSAEWCNRGGFFSRHYWMRVGLILRCCYCGAARGGVSPSGKEHEC